MPAPNFLIAGTAKAGTTSLYHYLEQHPDVFMSDIKEPHFFSCEGKDLRFRGPGDEWLEMAATRDWNDYCQLFDTARGEQARGEATPLYLYSAEAPARIRKYVPEMKIIVVLRNPVDRAYSQFWHMINAGREPLTDFGEAVEMEERRRRDGWEWYWRYTDFGFYGCQLTRYFDLFPQDQIKVIRYEDLATDSATVVQEVFRFLEVDDSFRVDTSRRYNRTGLSGFAMVDRLIQTENPLRAALRSVLPLALKRAVVTRIRDLNLHKPPLPASLQASLVDLYREDIYTLQSLLRRDFSDWLDADSTSPTR